MIKKIKKALISVSNKNNLKIILKLFYIFLFVSIFLCLFDQTGSSWILQAEQMDKKMFGIELLSSQILSFNPIMILIFTPIFFKYLYPKLNLYINLTPANKILIGFILTFFSFVIITIAQYLINLGFKINIIWQIFAYAVLTSGEIFVSITCLEISYTHAPKKLKSVVVAFFLLSISLGNLFTSLINFLNEKNDGSLYLTDVNYFIFFSLLMLLNIIFFIPFAQKYKKNNEILQS